MKSPLGCLKLHGNFSTRVPRGLEPTIITYSVMIHGSNSTATHSLITRYLRADLLHYKCIKRKIASPRSRLGCLGRITARLLAKETKLPAFAFRFRPFVLCGAVFDRISVTWVDLRFRKYLCRGSEISERRREPVICADRVVSKRYRRLSEIVQTRCLRIVAREFI